MPRYRFNFEDGFCDPDPDGEDLPDMAAAKQAAVRFLGQYLCDRPREFWRDGNWLLTVTDDAGLALFAVRVVATEAPASLARATIALPQP